MTTPQTPILTITLNPALDLATAADAVVAGPKLRCDPPGIDPGGGGINAARAIVRLGGTARAFAALGGLTGAHVAALMDGEGVESVAFEAPGETRQSLAVTDRSTGAQFRFVLPGPHWPAERVEAVLAAVPAALGPGGLAVLSGSQPPGVGADFPHRLVASLAGRGRLLVDTSGPALAALVAGGGPGPAILRMDQAEAEEMAGRTLGDRADSAAYAETLVQAGVAQVVVLARGADGSVLADGNVRWHCAGADVAVRSKIGAGDSFVGAFTLALARGHNLPEALQWGTAAASAAVKTEATALFEPGAAERLRADCRLSQL